MNHSRILIDGSMSVITLIQRSCWDGGYTISLVCSDMDPLSAQFDIRREFPGGGGLKSLYYICMSGMGKDCIAKVASI